MRTLPVKVALARAVAALARAAGRGGTSLPGKVLVRLAPDAIARLSARLARGTALISATNGKTTTATMAATVLQASGVRLVHNRAGANMAGGIASALLAARRGIRSSEGAPGPEDAERSGGELGLFEVDEFWLDRVAPQVHPRALVLGNLFRDQLDRYGELEAIADRWAATVAALGEDSTLILNADDPLIADLGRHSRRVLYFGVEDPAMAQPEMQHASDSKHCRRCGHAYIYEAIYLGHLGRYSCPNCGQRRPETQLAATNIRLQGTRGAEFELHSAARSASVRLPLPGLYNVYNALAAAGLCLELGIPLERVAEDLGRVAAAFGRAETVLVGHVEVQILLMKNPAGANEILRTLALEDGELELLAILNDRTADGRDISWVWDADFELLSEHIGHVTCAGTRAGELAVRLKYAGVPVERLDVLPAPPAALDRALERAQDGRRLFVLPTYTALLDLRHELAARGHARPFWEPEAVR